MGFKPDEIAEYGWPQDYAVGGHWYEVRILSVNEEGVPTSVQVKNGRGEWMEPKSPAMQFRIGYVLRHKPKDPFVIRSKKANTKPGTRDYYSYVVSMSKAFPALQIGRFNEAYTWATKAEMKKALAWIDLERWVVLRVSTAKRDEIATEP